MHFTKAIEDALSKTLKNIDRFGEKFPHVSQNGTYELNDNTDWTNGFWSGMLWLCYEYTQDERYRHAAESTVANFRKRLDNHVVLDHHDIGFLYSLSSKAQWIVTKDEEARKLTLEAADVLLRRWREPGEYIQAWGTKDDPKEAGRIIIDCLLNLPLLYWASEQTGDPSYREAAIKQAEKSRRYLVRGDDSSYHTFFFNPETGAPIGGATHQGYSNGSTWTRGQAWGVYGFALSYRYTKNPLFLNTSKRVARYFLEHLPEDHVAYWDFNAPVGPDTYRDSSASAIVAAGLVELISHLDDSDPDRSYFEEMLMKSMESLVERYSTIGEDDAEGLLKHGSYYVHGGLSPDDYMIWGDYFYLEALMRMEKDIHGYWYERK
ncbi:glycoside hydrolase family 88 protein [Paenibacillus sp.]|jgi:unsaturated chondroitin disaccharide hydrolase|uniref:glycoside hydrolase family 88 protein n=1 Tax=Paenibacillus sp. TaxID=58172 RepID=UPI0028300C5F|nr:glycoside hydrolase family 88 protein [Paenibacillus sp.]MDR0267203.1 glycoside hydrolase family 88 protein [Paenibacillus sp.]